MTRGIELIVNGFPGPTHHFGGLSYGNIASMSSSQMPSSPKKAALEVLEKMRLTYSLGIPQLLLPPHERPFLPILRSLGFSGTNEKVLKESSDGSFPMLLSASSSAAMWAANAATVSPSIDSGKTVHFTPANLISKFHRSFEAPMTGLLLFRLFNHPLHFEHHLPLPPHSDFADEGAANHLRFCKEYGEKGIQLFVYGRSAHHKNEAGSFPARQTLEASEAVCRLHRLDPKRVFFAKQQVEAIDAGVFHNDVISMANKNVFILHEKSFENQKELLKTIQNAFSELCLENLTLFEISDSELSLKEAVKTYFFNSELLSLSDTKMALIAPKECEKSPAVQRLIKRLTEETPIQDVYYQDLKESMKNGGGPACLRLRVVLTPQELSFVHQGCLYTEKLGEKLEALVHRHYRETLHPKDLQDLSLFEESCRALDALSALLDLPAIYPFQRSRPKISLPEKPL